MDDLIEKLTDPSTFAALYAEAAQAAMRIKKAEAALEVSQALADDLYQALRQMKSRRGVDIDDAELVIGALERYEKTSSDE